MKLNKFEKLYYIFIDNVSYFCLNNPISKKNKLQKIDKTLTILDIDKVKQITVDRTINEENLFIRVQKENIKIFFENFITIMNSNFEEEDLQNLYNNIIWVVFKKLRFSSYKGDYNPIKNIIRTLSEKDKDSINHELLHLSSNPYDKTKNYGGFYYTIDGYKIGYGIDEGYTELLNKRYFNSKTQNVYSTQIFCCELLEEIIGQRNMEKMYLNADLLGFINYLKQFYSKQEIERFICAVDFTHDYGDKNRLADCEIEALFTQIQTIMSFLFKGKCKILYEINIEENILEGIIYDYISLMINKFLIEIDDLFIDELNLIIEKNLKKKVKLDINRFKEKQNVL